MNNLNFDTLEKSVDIIGVLFEPIDWNESELNNLNKYIRVLEESFNQEIQSNMFGKNLMEKNDIIRICINKIGEVFDNFIWINFDEDEDINAIILNRIKRFFQFLIDIICTISSQNNINLIKIVDGNPTIADKLDFSIYYSKNIELTLALKTNKSALELSFLTPEAPRLFDYLLSNFDTKFSDHNKFSCIYRLMIEDGFLECDLKSERFKFLLKSVYKINNINFFLKSRSELSLKIINHYNSLKNSFLTN